MPLHSHRGQRKIEDHYFSIGNISLKSAAFRLKLARRDCTFPAKHQLFRRFLVPWLLTLSPPLPNRNGSHFLIGREICLSIGAVVKRACAPIHCRKVFERQSGSAAIVNMRNEDSPKSQGFIFALPQPAHDPDRQPRDQGGSLPMSCASRVHVGEQSCFAVVGGMFHKRRFGHDRSKKMARAVAA